jgi:CheY-like chemotaxis protein
MKKRKRIGLMSRSQSSPQMSGNLPEILYVEDENANYEVTELRLRGSYRLVRATTDRETFDVLRTDPSRFKAILMDIRLKGSKLDGIQITRTLRGAPELPPPEYAQGVLYPDMPIIFVTAYVGRYNREMLMEAGGDELVAKPVDFLLLTQALTNIITERTQKILAQANEQADT